MVPEGTRLPGHRNLASPADMVSRVRAASANSTPPRGLLSEQELVDSPVVANTHMNRDRRRTGSNGYDRELGIDPLAVVLAAAAADGTRTVRWLDLCCGSALALRETAERLEHDRDGARIELHGIDLVDHFDPAARRHPRLSLEAAPLHEWSPGTTYDLITCVHGIHYVGDKLGMLARTASWLEPDGCFVASFDARSVRLVDASAGTEARLVRGAGFDYDSRRRRIALRGARPITFDATFLGADPAAGPNYTGQPAVDSWYEAPGVRTRR